MVDVLWLAIGVTVGALATAIGLEASGRSKKTTSTITPWRLIGEWNLQEFQGATFVARNLHGVEIPAGSTVIVSGEVDPLTASTCRVLRVSRVKLEFIHDAKRDRALIVSGGFAQRGSAVLIAEPQTMSRLAAEVQGYIGDGSKYEETRPIRELAGRTGITVSTRGVIRDVLPYRDSFLIRLEDDGHVIGARVRKDPSELLEEYVLIRGPMVKDDNGYSVIDVEELRRIRRN